MKNLRAYHFLKENVVSIAFDSLGKRTHAKLLVIDEETVILGSTNWSREALDENYEANLLARSPQMARSLLEEFKTIELPQPERAVPSEGRLRISSITKKSRNFSESLLCPGKPTGDKSLTRPPIRGQARRSKRPKEAFFKEKDPAVTETLLALRWTYSPEWLDRAMKEVILKKNVGNPARSFPYLIGILKQWKEKGEPTLSL